MRDYTIRLVDRIRSGSLLQVGANYVDPGHWAASEEQLKAHLLTVPRIVADNIDEFEYWHWREPGRAGKEQLDPYDVPNLVPPFSSFWLEWKWFDPDIRRMGNIIGGALVECFELPEEERKRPADRFIFRVLPFAGRTDGLWHSVWAACAISSEAGELVECWAEHSPFARGMIDEEATREAYRRLGMAHLTNVLIAISFLNCRNVALADAEVAPRALAKSHHWRTGEWLTRHKTIVITPMSRLLRAAMESDPEGGRERAMHVVRGHFKRYAERGLFGKYKGTYFWHQQARGKMAAGEVQADYLMDLTGRRRMF